MTVNLQNSPYLPRQRNFPNNSSQALGVELDKAYIDIANRVNVRTIGIFSINYPSITGETWYFDGQQRKQQTLRQVFEFGAIAPGATLLIPYTMNGFEQFSHIYGTCITSIPDSRPLPYASVTANANIELKVDTVALNIVISNGASSPSIVSGIIISEWLTVQQNSNP